MSLLATIAETTDMRPSERKVARAVVADYPSAALGTVASLASTAGVSKPTVVRFAKALGFGSFSSMQQSVRADLRAEKLGPLSKLSMLPVGQTAELTGFAADVSTRATLSLGRIPAAEIDAAVAALCDTRGFVYTSGGRYSTVLASHLAVMLASVRARVVHIADSLGSSLGHLVDLQSRDTLVLFDFSRYQETALRLATFAAERGAGVVLVTDEQLSPAAQHARVVLPVAVDASTPLNSYVGAITLVEYIVAKSIDELGDHAVDRLAKWERARSHEMHGGITPL